MQKQITRLMRLPEVIQAVGYKRTRIYEGVRTGEFPAPVSLGPRAIAWASDAIEAWIESKIKGENKTPKAPIPTRKKKAAAVSAEMVTL